MFHDTHSYLASNTLFIPRVKYREQGVDKPYRDERGGQTIEIGEGCTTHREIGEGWTTSHLEIGEGWTNHRDRRGVDNP